jgi:hypothetical protein
MRARPPNACETLTEKLIWIKIISNVIKMFGEKKNKIKIFTKFEAKKFFLIKAFQSDE